MQSALRAAQRARRLSLAGTPPSLPTASPRALTARRRFGTLLSPQPHGWLAAYSAALHHSPVLTKTATAIAIAVVADAIAQAGDEGEADVGRTGRLALYTLCMTPLVHRWYGHLAQFGPLARMVRDQALFAPLGTANFLFCMAAMRDGSLAAGLSEARDKTPTVLLANWAVWVPAQLVNFAFVPPPYNILFANVVNLGWTVWLVQHAARGASRGKGAAETTISRDRAR